MAGTAVDEVDSPYGDDDIARVARALEAHFEERMTDTVHSDEDFTDLARVALAALGPPLIAGTTGSGKGSVLWSDMAGVHWFASDPLWFKILIFYHHRASSGGARSRSA